MISIISPAYNNPDHVDRLLGSLAEQCGRTGGFEAIVVDDGSRDDSLRAVCARYPFARYVRQPENRGASAARNAGAAAAAHELLMFLDSDMVALSDVISLAEAMFRDPGTQAVIGEVSEKSMNPGRFRTFWALFKAYSHPSEGYSSTFWPTIGVIRKPVFQKAGGFNERFKGASVEDYEFSIRLEARGYRVHCNPALSVGTHYKGITDSLRQSFSRAGKWVLLFGQRRRFDNHTTTGAQAAVMICGAAFVFASLFALAGIVPPAVPAALFAAYAVLAWGFLRYVRSRAGVAFVPVAWILHLLLSVFVTAGALRGALLWLAGPERRQSLLYGAR